jgi:hypothetical protein
MSFGKGYYPGCHAQPFYALTTGLNLERARVPMTPIFPGGHTENLLTVPAWHTDYFSHSNFHFLEKKLFFII